MALEICVIRENFQTILKTFDDISVNEEFLHLQRVAWQESCLLIGTIDPKGSTIINQPQLELFIGEIKRLRNRTDINCKILDRLREIADAVIAWDCEYIRFMSNYGN